MKQEPLKSGIVSEDTRALYESRQIESIAARWDARASTWDENLRQPDCHLNEDAAYARFIEISGAIVAQRKDFCQTHGVIDCGCGTGLVLESLVSSFSWGMGVDISRQMICAAQSKAIPNCRFVVGDCFSLRGLCPKARRDVLARSPAFPLWAAARKGFIGRIANRPCRPRICGS